MSPVLRACAKCGAIGVPGESYCARHLKEERDRRAAKHKAYGYNSAHWRAVRLARLEAANYTCEIQLPGCTGLATHVHLAPSARGRHYEARLEDTQAACAACSGAIDAPRSHRDGR
jgi:hypothetical protein